MILSILTSCHTPSAPSPEAESGAHYVKASAKRFSMPASPVKKRNSRLKRKSVVIGTPSGFRHEFHLGRDVDTMAELWDLERWREEIEHRVQEAAAEHAAINAAAAAQAEEEEAAAAAKTKRPRPQSMIRRKPVPSLNPNDAASAEPVPPLPTVTVISPGTDMSAREESDSTPSASSCSSSDDACSDMSSLPPSTPPSTSPRASTDLKYVDVHHLAPVVEPMVEGHDEVFAKTLSASLLQPKSTTIQYGEALSTTDEYDGVCHPPLHGDIAVAS